jgi:glycosyltransferase involved in cell wall biosynthesis
MMAARQAGVGLTVVGDGPERSALQRYEGDGVQLVGWRSDEEIRDLYQSSTAAILPGEEDFGIVPVEAQACGRPVVALGRGGALDTVIDGDTGVLFPEPTVDSLAAGLQRAAATAWDSQRIRRHAERFSRARFVSDIERVVDETLSAPIGQRW